MDKEFLKNLYWKEELSTPKIGYKLGINQTTVLYWMKKFNIPRRSLSEGQTGTKNWNYGKSLPEEQKNKIRTYMTGAKNPNFGKHPSEETLKKRSESLRGPKHPCYGKHPSEKTRIKMSQSRMNKHPSEVTCRKITESRIGSKNPNWRDGISFESYTLEFNKVLKKEIRNRDNYTCQICFRKGSLHIHHIDYNKNNCHPSNLITLCNSCHTKTNFNRKFWITCLKQRLLEAMG